MFVYGNMCSLWYRNDENVFSASLDIHAVLTMHFYYFIIWFTEFSYFFVVMLRYDVEEKLEECRVKFDVTR